MYKIYSLSLHCHWTKRTMPNQKHSHRQKSGKNKNTDKGSNKNCDNSQAAISKKIDGKQEKLSPLSSASGKNIHISSPAEENKCPQSCQQMHNSILKLVNDVKLM